ncbi:cation-independent mannose-6-phosphate receptor-like [Biomphalaria glabrata]|uniref:Cation-independent mannose-6-phosphate receptor-like n=1 Tax=Biomphalaria glabrata TaxID=6526 RepID=A0A9U8EMV1_BIOGL|nr:cation-independent mannose-6-phosphate receptor-like [Biomphalaria glabrata]
MNIEWFTEYACPTDYIISNTCQMTAEKHGINIDLSPLTHKSGGSYLVNATEGNDQYVYYINVCGNVAACKDKGLTPVCQRKWDDDTFEQTVGKLNFMQLIYSDGNLLLTYKDGDSCSSKYKRATTIEFVCDKTAVNDVVGKPEFVQHNNCSYYFRWSTKYACVEPVEPVSSEDCKVQFGGKKYDLSSLIKNEETNWQVITGENEADKQSYFLNVCHNVLRTDNTKNCPPESAICRTGNGEAQSLGQFKQSLKYNPVTDSLTLNYIDGSKTDMGCIRQTIVNFICAPGSTMSAPKLFRKSNDDCYFEIEWYTSAACVLSRKTGDNCRIDDKTSGYVYDLNPLKKDKEDYTVHAADGFTYLINVCAKINDDKHCVTAPHNNASICQFKDGGEFKVAEPATQLEYFDGVLNLTYTNGEKYNDKDNTPRSAEIAFVCDRSEDVGNPEFLEEKDFTYAFLWRTSYACPLSPIECAVTDEESHNQYDLSSLSKVSGFWETEISSDSQGQRTKLYINVCRPLGTVPHAQCNRFSSVCATTIDTNGKETLFHGNLGKAVSSPVIDKSSHEVKLVYTSGENCTEDGTVKQFTTTIQFVCAKGNLLGGPRPPRLISPCEYVIQWDTEAACPVTTDVTQSSNGSECTVQDRNTGFLFNLLPLKKADGYEVTSADNSQHFKLNLCGSLPDSVCGQFDKNKPTGICELKADKSGTSVAKHSTELKYSSQGELTLTYEGLFDYSGDSKKYVFTFICDRSAQVAKITFVHKTSLTTTFKVDTSLACPPQPVNCVVMDAKGQQFDLTPLARVTGNWVVIDIRPDHTDLRYHINVCRPVNPTPDMTCPGGAVGGCQTSSNSNNSFNLGWVQSEPVVSDAAITLHYEGGDKCHVGKDTESYRSTRIIFFCDAVEHNPVFQSESDTCEYTFIWKTPSACPQKVTEGDDCKVTDPLYNYQFDLNPLRNATSDYAVLGAGYKFLVNLCGPLVSTLDNCGSAGACQTSLTLPAPVQIGLPNNKPRYQTGQISLVYSDGKGNCHGKYNRSTIINFVCDHAVTGLDGPRYLEEKSDCTYMFEWTTKAVCPPHQVVDCTLQKGDDVYDLSRLSQSGSNYERTDSDPTSKQLFLINICRSLVHKKDQICPFDSAACRIDLTETDPKKRYHNIGRVTSQSLVVEQGNLVLRYDDGEPCGNGKRSTVILFQCDEKDDSLGIPGGHVEINGCQDHFIWQSSAACPQRPDKSGLTEANFGDCTVTNFNTGYKFDLSSLKRPSGYTTYDRDGHEFTLNVCGWVDKSTGCVNGTGACQVSQVGLKTYVNTGKANARPIYKDGVIVLEYKEGELCNSKKVPKETYINFICDQDAGTGVPVYIDRSDDCIYYFHWETQLVCEKEVKCEAVTDADVTLDFSPLILKSGQYNVLPSDSGSNHSPGTIFINLCRPLNPLYGTLCPPGSAACLVRAEGTTLNLGRVDKEPVYDKTTKEVKLTYTNGDSCPTNRSINISSVIILKCGNSKLMSPVLEGLTSDCEYIFMWETLLACPESSPQKLSQDCTYYDSQMRTRYNLSSLAGTYSVSASAPSSGRFKLNPCAHLDEKGETGGASCVDSAVCLIGSPSQSGSYGDAGQGKFQKDTAYLMLKFSQGRPCSSGTSKAQSIIYFKCNRTAGKGQPELMGKEDDCQVTFLWQTDLVCPVDKMDCLITYQGLLFDFSFLSRESNSWNFTDEQKNVYWLNLCHGVQGEALAVGCQKNAAVCRRTSDNKIQMLGKLQTQQMEVISGDKTSIIIKYSYGDADVCSAGGRRRSDIAPKVSVNLTCGSTIGTPVLAGYNSEECTFNVGWKTRLACPVSQDKLQVKEVRGLVYDVRTGLTISLKPLLKPTNQYTVGVDNSQYIINLGAPVHMANTASTQCAGAAVCLRSETGSYKNLGHYSSKAYYMEDEHLEIVFTSQEKCQGSQSHLNITSIFSFHCADVPAESSKPEFLYKTSDCAYMFDWDTNLVCFSLDVSLLDGSTNSAAGGPSANRVAIGVSVFLFIALVCIFVLIFYKPERRAKVAAKLKRVLLCRKTENTPIVYSRLNQIDQDDDPFNPFSEPDEESEMHNNQLPSKVGVFHDDSDDDILL